MLSKTELLKFIVRLVEVNDAELIDDDSLLPPEICAADDRAAIRQLRDLIQCLYRDFNYLESPEFVAMGSGRSDTYRDMLAKRYRDPEKRKQLRKQYADAVATLLTDNRVYELTPSAHHKILDDLRTKLGSVANSDRESMT